MLCHITIGIYEHAVKWGLQCRRTAESLLEGNLLWANALMVVWHMAYLNRTVENVW